MTARHLRLTGFCAFCCILCLFIALRIVEHTGKGPEARSFSRDFTAYYVAGTLVLSGDVARIYEQEYVWKKVNQLLNKTDPSQYYFLYPPFVAWACAPLGLLSLEASAWWFFAFNFSLAIWLSFTAPKWLGLPGKYAPAARWLFLGSIPLWSTLYSGQNGNISLCIALLAWRFHSTRRPFVAGMVLALGLYKPQLFFALYVWMLLWGDRRSLGGMAWGGLLLTAAGSIAGFSLWTDWWRSIHLVAGPASNPGALYSLQNLFDFWEAKNVVSTPAWLRLTCWTGLAALWACALLRLRTKSSRSAVANRETSRIAFGLCLLAGIVLTPRIYHYDMGLVFPVAVIFWIAAKQGRLFPLPPGVFVGIAFAFYLNELTLIFYLPLISVLLIVIFTFLCTLFVLPNREHLP